MIRLVILLTLLLRFGKLEAQQQSFSLNDTVFSVGVVYRFEPDFRFPTDCWNVSDVSQYYYENNKELADKLSAFLKQNPELVVELGRYLDFRGQDEQLVSVSTRQAEIIRDIFIDLGVDSTRLISAGYGGSVPLTVWMKDSLYSLVPIDRGEKVLLTEAYINQFKLTNPQQYQLLLSYLRRTELRIIAIRE